MPGRTSPPLRSVLFAAAAAGVATAILGAAGVTGWLADIERLLVVREGLPSMSYNAALALMLAGAGLLAAAGGFSRPARLLATAVMLISGLTLLQYLLGVDLGIDRLALSAGETLAERPLRMAPNTSLALLLGAAALALGGRRSSRRTAAMACLGSVVAAFGGVALFGYACGIPEAYGWGHYTQMAVLTAVGLVWLGAGDVALAWAAGRERGEGMPNWLPAVVAIGLGAFTLAIWQALESQDRRDLQRTVEAAADNVATGFQEGIQVRVFALDRMASRWSVRGSMPRQEWEADATKFLEQLSGFQAIGWADSTLHVRWVVAGSGGDGALDPTRAAEPWRHTLAVDSANRVGVLRTVRLEHGGHGLLVSAPITHGDRFLGLILGDLRVEHLVDRLVRREASRGYALRLTDGDEEIYATATAAGSSRAVVRSLDLQGVTWRLELVPTADLVAQAHTALPQVVLVTGFIAALLLAWLIRLGDMSRSRARSLGLANQALFEEGERRARSEEALRQLGSIVESSDDAILSTGLDGVLHSWNLGAERLFGYTRTEACGRHVSFLQPLGRHLDSDDLFQRIGQGQSMRQVETVNLTKDGLEVHVSLTISPVLDRHGHVVGVSTIARDITERNALDRLKQDFVSTVSHELRTPLAAIKGFVELVADGEAGPVTPTQLDFLDTAARNTDRLVLLINDLLDVERIGSSRIELRRDAVDLAGVLGDVADTFRLVAESKGLAFHHDIQAALPPISGDRDRLVQVFSNLVSNAVKYTPRGEIGIRAARTADGVEVTVRDTGIGLGREDQAQLFTKFFRAQHPVVADAGGTGLGLVIVKAIVEQHDGRISVESRPGVGTTFHITLPANEPAIAGTWAAA